MVDLSWVLGAGFIEMRFYDLPNFMLCVLFVLICGQRLRVPAIFQFVLLLHCLLPFFLNGVLFSFSFMPDAFKYWRAFNEIRGGDLSLVAAWQDSTVEKAATLFALMPFPFAVTPLSLGFFNTFLYVALFFWLYSKRVFTPISVWFFLLYPSMALYTGIGLRDTFIFIFMVVAIQWAREGRWWLALLPLYLLFMLKFQNFFILGPVLLLYVVFNIRKAGVSVMKAVSVSVIGLVTLLSVSPVALPLINKFRGAMYVEDGGDVSDVDFIETPAELIFEGMVSGLYFLSKPLPWEATNILQLIQAGENLIVIVVLFLLVRVSWKNNPKKLMFWLLFMALALTVYGLVVFNYGTAARYRYPFIAIFVLFVCADCRVREITPFNFRMRASGGYQVNVQRYN